MHCQYALSHLHWNDITDLSLALLWKHFYVSAACLCQRHLELQLLLQTALHGWQTACCGQPYSMGINA